MTEEPKKPQVGPRDTWASLAMKHYGDALLGASLAAANGVATSVPPAQVPNLIYPFLGELDPQRGGDSGGGEGGEEGTATVLFDDTETSVVREARYRMVMAQGGSRAVNLAPQSVSKRAVERAAGSREEQISEARRTRRDLGESLGERDGQALVLDVKPAPRPAKDVVEGRTTEDLAASMSTREGRELLLDVKPGQPKLEALTSSLSQREGKELLLDVKPSATRTDESGQLAEAIASKDGKALLLDIKPTKRKRTRTTAAGTEVVEEGPPIGERLGDQVGQLDGKALILDVRAKARRDETEEQQAERRKHQASKQLFDGLADRDGKELLLDVAAAAEDAQKKQRLKKRKQLAKKRKRRTGHGSLIPQDWKATGAVSADDVESYIDALRQQRLAEGEDPADDEEGALPQKAARSTHHRSSAVARPTYAEPTGGTKKRPETEGIGAFEEIQQEDLADAPLVRLDRPKRERPPDPIVETEAESGGEPEAPPEAAVGPGAQAGGVAPQAPETGGPSPGGSAATRPAPQKVAGAPRHVPEPRPDPADWEDDGGPSMRGVRLPPNPETARDWDDAGPAIHMAKSFDDSQLSGLSGTGLRPGRLPPVSTKDPYAPEAIARLCMISPGVVMQVARQAPMGAGPVLQLIGGLRAAKEQRQQVDLLRAFIGEHREDATATLELLLTT